MTTPTAHLELQQSRRAGVRRTAWIFALVVAAIYAGVLWRGFAG
jgi:hypothetical protein